MGPPNSSGGLQVTLILWLYICKDKKIYDNTYNKQNFQNGQPKSKQILDIQLHYLSQYRYQSFSGSISGSEAVGDTENNPVFRHTHPARK